MNKEQQLEAPDKIPSALQFIKRIAPLSETFSLKGVETMMESYALLREQRAVDVERKEWQQLVLESYIENQSAIQSAIEVERKKWKQFIQNRIDLIPDDDDLPLSQRGLLDAYINCLNYFKSNK